MPFKRKFKNKNFNVSKRRRGYSSGNLVGKSSGKRKRGSGLANLAQKVRRITATIETKSGSIQLTDNVNFQHNNFKLITSSFVMYSEFPRNYMLCIVNFHEIICESES